MQVLCNRMSSALKTGGTFNGEFTVFIIKSPGRDETRSVNPNPNPNPKQSCH